MAGRARARQLGKFFPSPSREPSNQGRFKLTSVNGRAITENGVLEPARKLVLYTAKHLPISKRTGLWVDNLIPLINGPQEQGRPILATIDLEFAFGEARPYAVAQPEVVAYGLLGRYPEHVLGMVEGNVSAVVHETARVPFWLHQQSLKQAGIARPGDSPAESAPGEIALRSGLYAKPIVISADQTAIIGPGQTLEFAQNAGILVLGTLRIQGSRDNPVILKAHVDSWKGILVVNESTASPRHSITWAKIENARGGSWEGRKMPGGLTFVRSSATLRDVAIRGFTSDDAINLYHSLFEIERLAIDQVAGDGIDSDWSHGEIKDSRFTRCGGDCLDFSGSHVLMRDNTIDTANDKAVSVGEGSVVLAIDNRIARAKLGFAVKDSSHLLGRDNIIRDCGIAGIALYVRRPNYGPPASSLSNTVVIGSQDAIRMDYSKISRQMD